VIPAPVFLYFISSANSLLKASLEFLSRASILPVGSVSLPFFPTKKIFPSGLAKSAAGAKNLGLIILVSSISIHLLSSFCLSNHQKYN
jgi:hypothetical protein